MRRPVIVCATCRSECAKRFIEAWAPWMRRHDAAGLMFADTDDQNVADEFQKLSDLFVVYHHGTVSRYLGEAKAWIIPNKTSACKSFAIYRAWKQEFDPIIVLDDDCYPADSDLVAEHTKALTKKSYNWITPTMRGLVPRGSPYLPRVPVGLNVGLWLKNPDIDAALSLVSMQIDFEDDEEDPGYAQGTIPLGALFPMSGMNIAFRNEIAPLMYFGLHGESFGVDRFDDIFAGWIVKRVLDHLGFAVQVGRPYVVHDRASDPLANIVKEANGYRMNNELFQFIRTLPIEGSDPVSCLTYIGEKLHVLGFETGRGYWDKYAAALKLWAGLFKTMH